MGIPAFLFQQFAEPG